MGTGSFPGSKRPGRDVDHPPHLAPRLKEDQSYGISVLPLWGFVAYSRVNSAFFFYLDRNWVIDVCLTWRSFGFLQTLQSGPFIVVLDPLEIFFLNLHFGSNSHFRIQPVLHNLSFQSLQAQWLSYAQWLLYVPPAVTLKKWLSTMKILFMCIMIFRINNDCLPQSIKELTFTMWT
jgi:hypothetical protein